MTNNTMLEERSNSQCELCKSKDSLQEYDVEKSDNQISSDETSILICQTCLSQIEQKDDINVNHWHCLNDSMWSPVQAVQIVSWRMLTRLNNESWARDLIDMMYLDDEAMSWAKYGSEEISENDAQESIIHKDCNGVTLSQGDTVVVIKDLNVKGSSIVAKRGTAVRGISLVQDNAEQIEGRVSGQQIVILTQFVKKS